MSRREEFEKLARVVDFGKTAGDYSKHRQGFPASFYERMTRYGVGLAGQTLLDVGTGTGSLARAFARRGCRVTGLDASPAMLAEAAELARQDGCEVTFVEGRAEDTGLPDGSFDCVTAGCCWHWFDGARAPAEARRVLRPGGLLVITSLDWQGLPGNVVDETEALIERHNPSWRFRGMQTLGAAPLYLRQLAIAGFTDLETFTYDEAVSYTHEAWRGRIRASAGVGASMGPEAVKTFDDELGALLARQFPGDPLAVPHRVFVLVARAPSNDTGRR